MTGHLPSAVTRHDIAFPADDGTILRGWLYAPDGLVNGRGVVMMHGFSATKEMALDQYAEIIAASGINVLVYDHRGLGASDGEPRQMIDPWLQARDILTAIDWLSARPEVDPQRIGVWGSSFSGGHALAIGGVDARVRAVVANVPFVGKTDDLPAGADALAALSAGIRSATIEGLSFGGPIAVVTESGVDMPAAMPQPDAAEWFLTEGRKPEARWLNEARPSSRFAGSDFNPAVALAHLHGPVLFVVAAGDRQAPAEKARAAHALAGPDSEFLLIEGHHFTPYRGEALQKAASAARDFFLRWL